MIGRWGVLLLGLVLPGLSFAQHSQRFFAGPVFGAAILGSEDLRKGVAVYYGHAAPSRPFSFKNVEGLFVVEGYANGTIGGGFDDIATNSLGLFGVTFGARYPLAMVGRGGYVQGGWGLSYGSAITRDLDSRVNSTPYLAIGRTFANDGLSNFFELRYMHFSNAGLAGSNQGSNQVQFLFGVEF